jgi:hypothetical protein
MKFFASILLTYLSLVIAVPSVCGISELKNQSVSCCSSEKKECTDPASKDENNIPSCYPCCSIQNCHCFPEKTLEVRDRLNFISPEEKMRIQNEKPVSNFSGDCWQPPELS